MLAKSPEDEASDREYAARRARTESDEDYSNEEDEEPLREVAVARG